MVIRLYRLVKTPASVKVKQKSDVDKSLVDFTTQKVTGDVRRGRRGGRGGRGAEEAHLNFRRFELCLASKPCTTPCNPIQGSMGKQDPPPVCAQSGL